MANFKIANSFYVEEDGIVTSINLKDMVERVIYLHPEDEDFYHNEELVSAFDKIIKTNSELWFKMVRLIVSNSLYMLFYFRNVYELREDIFDSFSKKLDNLYSDNFYSDYKVDSVRNFEYEFRKEDNEIFNNPLRKNYPYFISFKYFDAFNIFKCILENIDFKKMRDEEFGSKFDGYFKDLIKISHFFKDNYEEINLFWELFCYDRSRSVEIEKSKENYFLEKDEFDFNVKSSFNSIEDSCNTDSVKINVAVDNKSGDINVNLNVNSNYKFNNSEDFIRFISELFEDF